MKKGKLYLILLLLACIPTGMFSQTAEYNAVNNWVYPTAEKYVGMDFINASTGKLINNGAIWYSHNFTNSGVVDFVGTLATNPALSKFSGSATQHISGTGTTRFYSLEFSSQLVAGAYSLEQNVTVAHQVDFTKGILTSLQTTPETMTNMLLLENSAISMNTSDNSYVDGFVSKTGNSAFTFPIGNGGFYRSASISAPALTTDCFAARYLYANPNAAGYTRTSKENTISQVSDKEYWVVNRTSGSSNVQLTLSWDSRTSTALPANLNQIKIVRWDGTKWIDEGNVSATGTVTTGTVTANVTGYGVFTLAAAITNPPVAVDDNVTSFENNPATGNVSANDQVSNGTTLTVTGFSIAGTAYAPGSTATIANVGTITIAAGGSYTFTPVLNYSGTVPTVTYTISDEVGLTDTGDLIIKVLPLPELQKSSTKPVMNNDGTFSWTYILSVQNDTPFALDSIQIKDNLDDVFKDKGCTYTITSIIASGTLIANGLYNGSSNTNTLIDGSGQAVGSQDTIRIEVKVDTHGQAEALKVFNQAVLTAVMNNVKVSLLSDDKSVDGTQNPTQTVIPLVNIFIPDAFSPNGDGINDKFKIVHDTSTRLEIEVFNRDGNTVYKNSDYQNDWEGKGSGSLFGKDIIDGTYFVAYKIIDKQSREVIIKGIKSITIRR